MKNILVFIFLVVFISPVAVYLGSSDGLPIYFSISTFFLLFSVFFKIFSLRVLALLSIPFFYIFYGFLSSIYFGGNISVLFSTFSFVLPLFFLFFGAQVGASKISGRITQEKIVWSYILVVFLIFFSDVFGADFPRGCGYEGRWGGCYLLWDVYGFPNASMNYLAVLTPILALPFINNRGMAIKFFSFLALSFMAWMSSMSLSRSTLLVYAFALLFFVYSILGVRVIYVFFLVFLLGVFGYDFLYEIFSQSGIYNRIAVSINSGDVTTGRLDIWGLAVDLISSSPFFGYGFLSFSNFSYYGTVHQQYLEVFYKVGLFGFVLYFYVLVYGYSSCIFYLRNKVFFNSRGKERIVFKGIVFGVLISCVFQPSLSYQVLGNLVFFCCGFFYIKKMAILNETNSSRYG